VPAHIGDADHDVLSGGPGTRPRRAVVVICAITAVLVAQPLWHHVARQATGTARPGASSAAQRPVTPSGAPRPSPPTLSQAAAPTLANTSGVLRPHARGSDLALRRWYSSLPLATAQLPGAAVVRGVFRLRHTPDITGARDFDEAAQVRGRTGWIDVAHGDIGTGRVDAVRKRVAFMVRMSSLPQPGLGTWVYIVSIRDAVVLRALTVPRQALLSGWFGDQAVIDQSAVGLPPVLLDGAGTEAPRELEQGINAVADGVGDVQFVSSDLVHCLTGWRLGLVPHVRSDVCPDDALVALSPVGRWAVTRDMRWLDHSTGRSRQLTGGPASWPVESVDFVDDQRALVAIRGAGLRLSVLCSPRGGCARLR
jgi:hypothetical protein